MPNPSRSRAAALAVTAVLLTSWVSGCGGDSEDEDLTAPYATINAAVEALTPPRPARA